MNECNNFLNLLREGIFMKYFFDTEFLEGTQSKRNGKQTQPTIDLISIGIVDENGREFYAISNEFNLKEAWNRYDIKKDLGKPQGIAYEKVYWIRENVLKPIFEELFNRFWKEPDYLGIINMEFNFKNLKYLIKKYGTSRNIITNSILAFIYGNDCGGSGMSATEMAIEPRFYAYYCSYDWVVFCWLFGKMINLPKGFPMYCNDLKQMFDEKLNEDGMFVYSETTTVTVDYVKNSYEYPKQKNEHSAIDDAKWNRELFLFLKSVGKKV
jgi:hypothetical protein